MIPTPQVVRPKPARRFRALNAGDEGRLFFPLPYLVSPPLGPVHLLARGAPAAAHHGDKAVEKVTAVMGAGARFRVVLDRENRLVAVPKALQSLVVEVDMGRFASELVKTLHLDGKTVILTRYLNLGRV